MAKKTQPYLDYDPHGRRVLLVTAAKETALGMTVPLESIDVTEQFTKIAEQIAAAKRRVRKQKAAPEEPATA